MKHINNIETISFIISKYQDTWNNIFSYYGPHWRGIVSKNTDIFVSKMPFVGTLNLFIKKRDSMQKESTQSDHAFCWKRRICRPIYLFWKKSGYLNIFARFAQRAFWRRLKGCCKKISFWNLVFDISMLKRSWILKILVCTSHSYGDIMGGRDKMVLFEFVWT